MPIQFIKDITGDGLTDILLVKSSYSWGSTNGNIIFAKGVNNGFEIISNSSFQAFSVGEDFNYTFDPVTNQLSLVQSNVMSWDCLWDTTTLYSWNSGNENIKVLDEDPPNTPECGIAQATYPYSSLSVEESIRLLENAIYRYQVNPPENLDYVSFAHYRLALLYLVQGKQIDARQQLEKLLALEDNERSEAAAYLKSDLQELLEREEISLIPLCNMTYLEVVEGNEISSLWGDYLNDTRLFNAYPAGFEIYPQGYCSISQLMSQISEEAKFDPVNSPTVFFENHNIVIKEEFSRYLESDTIPTWIVLIEFETPQVYAYVQNENGKYSWRRLYKFNSIVSDNYIFIDEDLTGDGVRETVIAYPSENQYESCDNDEVDYQIFITTVYLDGRSFSNGTEACIAVGQSLKSFLADDNGNGVSDWVEETVDSYSMEPAYEGALFSSFAELFEDILEEEETPQSLAEVDDLNSFTAYFYTTENPVGLRHIIQELLTAYNDQPYSQYAIGNLRYLLAKTYEIEGNQCAAVQIYIRIWQNAPPTLWSHLAALKVKLSEGGQGVCP